MGSEEADISARAAGPLSLFPTGELDCAGKDPPGALCFSAIWTLTSLHIGFDGMKAGLSTAKPRTL